MSEQSLHVRDTGIKSSNKIEIELGDEIAQLEDELAQLMARFSAQAKQLNEEHQEPNIDAKPGIDNLLFQYEERIRKAVDEFYERHLPKFNSEDLSSDVVIPQPNPSVPVFRSVPYVAPDLVGLDFQTLQNAALINKGDFFV